VSDWLTDTRDLLAGLPHLRAALRLFAEQVDGPVADVGCGPGEITARLHALGVDVFHDALRPNGLLQLGFHVGDRTNRKTQGYGGHPMRVNVHLRQPERVAEWLEAAGFTVEAQWLLGTDGAVLFARRG
jgi:hypothetical protein